MAQVTFVNAEEEPQRKGRRKTKDKENKTKKKRVTVNVKRETVKREKEN